MIHFKVVQKAQPGVVGGGKKKYYAQVATDGERSLDELIAEIKKIVAVSEPNIRGVIAAIENVVLNALADNKIVRWDRLGTFYPALQSEGKENPQEVEQECIKKIDVNFRPGAWLMKEMSKKGFEKQT